MLTVWYRSIYAPTSSWRLYVYMAIRFTWGFDSRAFKFQSLAFHDLAAVVAVYAAKTSLGVWSAPKYWPVFETLKSPSREPDSLAS